MCEQPSNLPNDDRRDHGCRLALKRDAPLAGMSELTGWLVLSTLSAFMFLLLVMLLMIIWRQRQPKVRLD